MEILTESEAKSRCPHSVQRIPSGDSDGFTCLVAPDDGLRGAGEGGEEQARAGIQDCTV